MNVKTLKWLLDSIKDSHQNLRVACEWSVGDVRPGAGLTSVLVGPNGFLQEDNGYMSIAKFSQVIDELPGEDLDKEVYFYL